MERGESEKSACSKAREKMCYSSFLVKFLKTKRLKRDCISAKWNWRVTRRNSSQTHAKFAASLWNGLPRECSSRFRRWDDPRPTDGLQQRPRTRLQDWRPTDPEYVQTTLQAQRLLRDTFRRDWFRIRYANFSEKGVVNEFGNYKLKLNKTFCIENSLFFQMNQSTVWSTLCTSNSTTSTCTKRSELIPTINLNCTR